MNKNKAFTLTELVIVLAIIGIGTAASLSFNRNRSAGDLLRSSAKAHDMIYRINDIITYSRLLAILSRQDICVKLVNQNSSLGFKWCGTEPSAVADRSKRIKKKLKELFTSKRYPSNLNLPNNKVISFSSFGISTNNCSKEIIITDNLDEDGIGTRYEILRISKAGIARFCRSSNANDKCM